ncbi:MAG: beta-propeller domain-containing protein [Candidatus Bathyarchaeia archaeon]
MDKRKLASNAVIGLVLGSLLGAAMWNFGGVYTPEVPQPGFGSLMRFSSYEELTAFLSRSAEFQGYPRLFGRGFGGAIWDLSILPSLTAKSEASVAGAAGPDFSGTNIQVEGVDEADVVKTDGEYIYLATGKGVLIVKAYPPEVAEVVSRLELNRTVSDLFVSGDKLVVFLAEFEPYYLYPFEHDGEGTSTTILVYDISDRSSPTLERTVTVDGFYFNSRMIGDYIYVIIDKPAYLNNGEVDLPTIRSDGYYVKVKAPTIYYANYSDAFYAFTSIVAVNVQDPEEAFSHETFLLGAASSLYVSRRHIYITSPRAMEDDSGELYGTMIYKISAEDGVISYVADGFVPGWVLNQFSMDEHDGYFRIATTNGRALWGGSPSNNVYVLNSSLGIVGRLEGLAPGEEIYSARFMGSRCYLVTFKKVDPLVVIDLSDPERPEVLGKLKIPGYSDYLHPYDETHLIGVGKETEEAEEGGFAWYQGVKISLFDVGDVSKPRELAKYEVGDRGTDSPVLWDHKAFLFSRDRHLLVLPILVAEIDASVYSGSVPPDAYGEYVFQGAYVFNVSLTDGIRLRGRITHLDGRDDLLKSGYHFESPYSVKRALYIGEVLYTISDGLIKMNSLTDLGEVNRVELP